MSGLEKLAQLAGISSEYIDKVGQKHYTSDEVRKCFLSDMGYPCNNVAEIQNSITILENKPWLNCLDGVYSFFSNESDTSLAIRILSSDLEKPVFYSLEDEDGNIIKGEIDLKSYPIEEIKTINNQEYLLLHPVFFEKLSFGYHFFTLHLPNQTFTSLIIMAQPKCYLLDGMPEETFRVHGLAIQLYALRSQTNMGIGDFSDLKQIVQLTAQNGGDVVGLNPLGAMFPQNLTDVSPYRSLSRLFLNYVYIDLTTFPEFYDNPEIQQLQTTKQYLSELERLRSIDKVDYYGVFKFKLALLKLMFKQFCHLNLDNKNNVSNLGKEFLRFAESKGNKLQHLCLFEALLEQHNQDSNHNDWRSWPYNYGKINSFHTHDFANNHKDTLDFYAYCHWLADKQLSEISNLCTTLGMKIGLYLDSPIGAAASGVEVWENHEVFAENMGVGAPADPMRPRGQSWGFAPYHPQKLRDAHYEPFIKLIRENMLHAKALRIDHAMGLMRLFWVYFIKDNPVVQGAYVHYNLREMVAILSVESHRNKCLVIGEDLGTVPEGFREYMSEHGLLSNKIFFRQKNKDGSFLAPHDYQYLSLAQASTHDQATSYGYWVNEDIKTFNQCNLYVNEEQFKNNLNIRVSERSLLIKAFADQQTFFNPECQQDATKKLDGTHIPHKLEYAVNKYVAQTKSAIFLQRIEDIYGQVAMENVPGTTHEYPNWQVKLNIKIEDIVADARFKNMFNLIRQYR